MESKGKGVLVDHRHHDESVPAILGVGRDRGSSRSLRMEEICLKLRIDEKREDYVTDRLRREGRGGEVLRIDEHTVLYSGTFFDCNEMLPWIKTFTAAPLSTPSAISLTEITR